MRRFAFLPLLTLGVFVQTNIAPAGLIFFDNRADYNAATGAQTIIDFEGIAPDGDGVAFPSGVLTLSGVTFASTVTAGRPGTGDFVVVGKGSFTAFGFPSSALVAQQNTLDPDITATLPGPSLAFAVDFAALPAGLEATFALSTGATFTRITPSGSILSTDPFTSVKIFVPPPEHDNTDLIIDNFSFPSGASAAVLEPTSGIAATIGAAILSALCFRRAVVREKTSLR